VFGDSLFVLIPNLFPAACLHPSSLCIPFYLRLSLPPYLSRRVTLTRSLVDLMSIYRCIRHGARWLVLDLRARPYISVSACSHRLLYVAHHACTTRCRVGWMDGAAAGDTHDADLLVGATSPGADAKGGIDQSAIEADGRDGEEMRFLYISFFCFSSGGIPSYPFPFPSCLAYPLC
jgi:hypothetical protein